MNILIIFTSYLLGSLPTGFLIGKYLKNIDLRTIDSGSTGATNVLRNVGKWPALFVFIIDVGKGLIAVKIAQYYTDQGLIEVIAGISAVSGHIWPIWLRGKGGKAVATGLGMFLALSWKVGLASLGIFLIVLTKTKIVSPIDGFILDRHISVGDVLGAYQKDSIMFTIAETLSNMNIEIFIDESDIGNIQLDQVVEFSTDAFPDRKLNATISQIRYSPIDDQNVITYEVIASFDNPENLLLPGMTANVDIIVQNKEEVLKVKNSALSVKLNQKPKENSGGSRWGGGGASQMQEIMAQINMTADQQNKMRSVYPKLGKVRGSLEAKNLSPEKIRKEIQLYIENALVELLTDEQRNKYFSLKESLNVKKVYKLVDGSHEQIDLVTGLNSGGYTEIIKGEIQEGDEVISKIIVETSEKKALRLF